MEKRFPHCFHCGIESSDRIVTKSIHVWDGLQRVDLPVTSTSPEHMQPIYGHNLEVCYFCERLCVLTTLEFLLMTFLTESGFKSRQRISLHQSMGEEWTDRREAGGSSQEQWSVGRILES